MRFSFTSLLAFALAGPALAGPGVSPASVDKDLQPGNSFQVDKIVTTPVIPPKPEVVLLVDVTGSMTGVINDLKANLNKVIQTVTAEQPTAKFAVALFGDMTDPVPFKVVQDLTTDVAKLQAAVNSLKAGGGGDDPEDWINALYQISTGAIAWSAGSTRIVVFVSDNPSHDPSGGHTLDQTIAALKAQAIRAIAINVGQLDAKGQATAVTSKTGGVIVSSDATKVSGAIVSGLKNLDVVVKPDTVSCDTGLSVSFAPGQIQVTSGATATFKETVAVASSVLGEKTLKCSVRFLLNGTAGGDAFVQKLTVKVPLIGCILCNPAPGKNKCHITTACAPTPYGTMCLTRPGFKADGVDDDNNMVQWRLKWPVPGQEHRVAVKPGTPSNTKCDPKNKGQDVCKEIKVNDCPKPAVSQDGESEAGDQVVIDQDQVVMGEL